ncbi:DUF2877 domain-containing protein [Streptomyces sp. NPDC050418]|uniref:oxamate carbamoyltransferase subunit AllH family protein n=1 Tax=Streptomyces sp. NPDC050418 TaxID=3365612 RepID=UPI003795B912
MAHTGIRVPAAVVLTAAAGERPFAGITPGAVAHIGGGRVELGPLRLAAGVSWAPPRVQATPVAEAPAALAAPTPLTALARFTPPRELPAAVAPLAAGIDGHNVGAVGMELLGRGPGLTPSGDDFLCGLLLAANTALPRPRWFPALVALIALAPSRTTLVSASLLAHAAAGHCIPQVAELLRATAADGAVPVRELSALLAVGHSSGADLLHGLCAGARLLTA